MLPNVQEKWDSKLIDLLLSVYDGGTWAGSLSVRARPESRTDRAVDLVATRNSDGLRLAIEHTRIEPFVGERDDFHRNFASLQKALWSDESLRVPGFLLHIDMPVGTLPRSSDWRGITDDVARWIRSEHTSFTDRRTQRRCPSPHHPSRELLVQVEKTPLGDAARLSPLIVQRHGEEHLDESLEKALRNKLPKLVETPADRRMLLLERDQGWLIPADILTEVERRRPDFAALADVDEIWIADTASFEEPRRYAAFSGSVAGSADSWTFQFYDGTLLSAYRNGMPVPAGRGGA